jgi:hypothetical protein
MSVGDCSVFATYLASAYILHILAAWWQEASGSEEFKGECRA